jgi:hypothetical protein
MTDEKSLKTKLKFDKAVLLYAYIFLLLPVALFLCSWTKLYIGIPVCMASAAGFFIIAKAVEASAFAVSKLYFSRHMNQGKHFALFEINLKCLVRNV